MNMDDRSFLGRGWSFPPAFERGSQEAEMVSNEEDIYQSLMILFSTKPGERPMNLEYGCNLSRLSFEPINNSLINHIADVIHMAINKYEPRIRYEKIEVVNGGQSTGEGIVLVRIHYTIVSTNTRTNMVYPYYKIEGTNIIEE